ncbi:MAG: CocE/NonD family hydrolase, partial [Oceanidesulfovibrio sp.]
GLRYEIMGTGAWQRADSWPPTGSNLETYHLWAGNELSTSPEDSLDGYDRFTPDLSHGSGPNARWRSQLGQDDVHYAGLTDDPGLLSYTSGPLDMPTRLAGNPQLSLFVSADREDFTVFAYLEAVDPEGRRHYVTEGSLRAACRGNGTTPDFTSEGARSVVPGKPMRMTMPMLPIAMQIPAGYRLRLTIAGSDADYFARHPSKGPVALTIHRSRMRPSALLLPKIAPLSTASGCLLSPQD